MCQEWKDSFGAFLDYVGPKPCQGRRWTIDRIDNQRGYEPGNCRWVTARTNNRNKRTNHIVTVNGTKMTLIEAAEKHGLNKRTLYGRLSNGWSLDRALNEPVHIDRWHKK
jgi:hypothetical protein